MTASTASSPLAISRVEQEGKESDDIKQKEKQADTEEAGEVEAEVESNSPLVIDQPAGDISKERAVTVQAIQSRSSISSAAPLATGDEAPMEGEEEMQTEVASDLNVPSPEICPAMAVSSHTSTTISIYSSVVSSSQVPPSPTQNSSAINCNAIFPNP